MTSSRFFLVTADTPSRTLTSIWVRSNLTKYGNIETVDPLCNNNINNNIKCLVTFEKRTTITERTISDRNMKASINHCTHGIIQSPEISTENKDSILQDLKGTAVVHCKSLQGKNGNSMHKNRFQLTFSGDLPETVKFNRGLVLPVTPDRFDNNDYGSFKVETNNEYPDRNITEDNPINRPEKENTGQSKFDDTSRGHKRSSETLHTADTENDPWWMMRRDYNDLHASIIIEINETIHKLQSYKEKILAPRQSAPSSSKHPRKE